MDHNFATQGMVSFLFGIFCAYWAQETDRNPWLWFFFGFFLPHIAGIVLCIKNSSDKKEVTSSLPPHLAQRIKAREKAMK